MQGIITKRWPQVLLLLAVLAGAFLFGQTDSASIRRLRYFAFDYFNRLAPRLPSGGVVIVDIDEDSLKKLGQWPWPRTVLADMVGAIDEMGVKSIGFDMVFAEPDRTSPPRVAALLPENSDLKPVAEKLRSLPDNDRLFADKIGSLGNVVTSFVSAYQKTDMEPVVTARYDHKGAKPDAYRFVSKITHVAATMPEIANAAAGGGNFSVEPDDDGVIRRVSLLMGYQRADGKKELLPALSLETLRVSLDKNLHYLVTSFGERDARGYAITEIGLGKYRIPTDENGRIWVYYSGHRPDLYIPAWKVLERKVDPAIFKDKIVFVGTSAIGLRDLRASPLDASLPGVEVHAEIVEQILTGKFLQRPEYAKAVELAFATIICLLIVIFSPFIGTSALAAVSTLLIGGGFGGAFIAYRDFGFLIDPVYPSLMVLVIFILASMLSNLRTEAEKKQVRGAFGQYLSPVLIEELTKNPDKLKLGGEVRELSVIFTDVRNFTAIAERMDPAELIRMMNDFLTPMTQKIMDFRGTVDKYMGDAVMAFWNAPLDDPDHARNACLAALAMQDVMAPLNDELRLRAEKQGRSFLPLKTGIGIATGHCSVGNMGSRQRFAYSALGDTVNLASRIEGQTKVYGAPVMVSENTAKQVGDFALLELDLISVKGRAEPERIYALLGDAAVAGGAKFRTLKNIHDEMIKAYRARLFSMAAGLAGECMATEMGRENEALYAFYRERIAYLQNNPPPAVWNGVWVASAK